jgi:hypothetical protein
MFNNNNNEATEQYSEEDKQDNPESIMTYETEDDF